MSKYRVVLQPLLSKNELDIGLIPIVEYFRANDQGKSYRILPNISIASRGSVLSIQLFSRVPIQDIQQIALDTSSRSSVALLKILLARKISTFSNVCPLVNLQLILPQQKQKLFCLLEMPSTQKPRHHRI